MNSTSKKIIIAYIKVRELFGFRNYDIEFQNDLINIHHKLLLLYGDNGSGKTTILKILYHLLSDQPYSGHKTVVSKFKFRLFEVGLSDGTKISASRIDTTKEDYVITIIKNGKLKLQYLCESKTKQRLSAENDDEYLEVCDTLRSTGCKIEFLSTARIFNYGINMVGRGPGHHLKRMKNPIDEFSITDIEGHFPESSIISDSGFKIQTVIDSAINWFRQNTLRGANAGIARVSAVYTRIIEDILALNSENNSINNPDYYVSKLNELRIRNH
jgi:energy-coupling factor transporter ATP-binding protein EcfA2